MYFICTGAEQTIISEPSKSGVWSKAELAKKEGQSWFGRYRLLFLEDLLIDWNDGPVPPLQLEQLNLTRNDLIHSA